MEQVINNTTSLPPKKVTMIPERKDIRSELKKSYEQMRVCAYCRVSTKQDEQLNSYEVQKRYYTDRINREPKWKLVEIFADKGITGTSVKKRDEFNKMIRLCKKGKVDMIITKSISRFARNTVDCLKYVRMLKSIGVDVYFEEQHIHSTDEGAEFYITIYGCIAQSESENISANVKWGKLQSAKEGKVIFKYENFLGYQKGTDGNPEIVLEEAEIVRMIYKCFLEGDSYSGIAHKLEEMNIPSPAGKKIWQYSTIQSILTNEKYMGAAIINKTYITDCISKKVKKNNGERPKFYVENNHPAIIDPMTFARVQEEIARRTSKQKVKQVGTKTQQGKYSSKYALTELLVCGECGTPYRRCTWTTKGVKKVVWRCINRLDYGTKYCHESPSIEESLLQKAIMNGIKEIAFNNDDVLNNLKLHIGIGLETGESDDKSLEIKIRIAEIDAEFKELLKNISAEISVEDFDDSKMSELLNEKHCLEHQLEMFTESKQKRDAAKGRLDEICNIVDGLKNHPMTYDDKIIRQMLEYVIVESKEKIKLVFIGGTEIIQELI